MAEAEQYQARPQRPWSVRTYLLLIVATGVLALTAAVVVGHVSRTAGVQTAVLSDVEVMAERSAEGILDSIEQTVAAVEGLAAQEEGLLPIFDGAEGCTLNSTGTAVIPDVRLDIVDAGGTVRCSSHPSPEVLAPAANASAEWFAPALAAEGTIEHGTVTDLITGRRSLVITRTLGPADGPLGLIAAVLHLDTAAPAIVEQHGGARDTDVALVDVNRGLVVSTTSDRLWDVGPIDDTDLVGEGPGVWAAPDGADQLLASATVPDGGLTVLAAVPREEVLAGARAALWQQTLIALVAVLFLAAWAVVLNRKIAGPLRAVTDAVDRATADPSAPRAVPRGTAELVTLTRHVNAMLDIRAGHEAQLRHQSTHDPLTGLPNVVLLRDRLASALDSERVGAGLAVLSVGIDRFRLVNDSRGHVAGDRVLVQAAGRLSAALRPSDTLARFGGDVFLMLCQDVTRDDALAVAERLQACFNRPFEVPGTSVVVKASVGIAVTDGIGTSTDELLREVSTALHHAKRTSVRTFVFDQSLQAQATRHLEVERDLDLALQRDELVIHYQPQIDVLTGRITGVEALARWQHPQLGLIPPLDFIPTAEETGQIIAIGQLVLTRACQQAAAWSRAGHPVRMSVNVAATQLRHDDLPAMVARVLTESGLPAEQLCLEITESCLMTATEKSARDLGELRRMGVSVAIDDFGTGYSSLAYLHELPVTELKIDRSFIHRIGVGGGADNGELHLLQAIMGMARALGLTVVAEGVETDEQYAALGGLRCDLAQGFLLARPTTADQLLVRLTADRQPAVV